MSNYLFKWSEVPITGWIYFIEFQPGGPVKIGYASNMDKRLAGLQVSCPYELNVLHAAPGGRECEKAIHLYLDKFAARGEWFWPVFELSKTIRRLKSFEIHYPNFLDVAREIIREKSEKSIFDFYGATPSDLVLSIPERGIF